MSTTNVDIEIERLVDLPSDKFRDEVDADVRAGPTTARRAALRSPQLVDRWHTVLLQMAKSADGQLAARQEDYEAERARLRDALLKAPPNRQKSIKSQMEQLKLTHAKQRAGTLRFKTGVEEVLLEARSLRDSLRDNMYESIVAEERNRYAARVSELERAIREHRATSDELDLEPDIHDEHLWAVLDR